MILCHISDSARYASMSAGLAMAIDWLQAHIDDDFIPGRYAIGDTPAGEVFVKVEDTALIPREKASLESHRRYIDIHVPLKSTETIGWAPTSGLKHSRQPYDESGDIEFFGDPAHSLLHIKVGQMAVFFPSDAHAPNIGLGRHRKMCIKIPV